MPSLAFLWNPNKDSLGHISTIAVQHRNRCDIYSIIDILDASLGRNGYQKQEVKELELKGREKKGESEREANLERERRGQEGGGKQCRREEVSTLKAAIKGLIQSGGALV